MSEREVTAEGERFEQYLVSMTIDEDLLIVNEHQKDALKSVENSAGALERFNEYSGHNLELLGASFHKHAETMLSVRSTLQEITTRIRNLQRHLQEGISEAARREKRKKKG